MRSIAFGKEYDPWPFHVDEEAAGRSIFGDVIASALHTISACTRVVVEAHGEIAILSGAGHRRDPRVPPGAPGRRPDGRGALGRPPAIPAATPDRGIAGVKCRVVNQRGEIVLEYGYRYLVACRPNP